MMRREQISNSFAYASLACSLSPWLDFGLGYLHDSLHLRLPGLRWLTAFSAWDWVRFEAFGLLLAIIATVLGILDCKLWRLALPVAFLMFLLTLYVMWS